jgi:adenylate cyclase
MRAALLTQLPCGPERSTIRCRKAGDVPVARDQRKLAAIVAADVVGYSRLMGRDESGTLARLRNNRSERLDLVLAKYGGRLVKLTGDGALLEFASAVDALSAAIEFQQAMAEATANQPADGALVFRMGLHLGDLIVDGDDLYGDGVNVAARLEGEAPAGGILISRNVHDAVAGRVKATFEDLGGLSLKNIERPVRAFRVHWEASAWRPPAAPEVTVVPAVASQFSPTQLPLPDKPSIAVLPFLNMSGDPEQEYFSDGVTEDIITELSRFHSLFVIARNSSFSYKGKSPDIRQVGRDLGVRYVLEGSIRKSSNRIRVTGQLIDTLTGNHIWAERYDRVLEDIFAVQEEVTRAIVAAIAPQIESTEHSKAARRRPDSLSAYEIALLAWAHAWQGHATGDRALLEQANHEARDALAIDQRSVLALHTIAYACGVSHFLFLAEDREHALREAMLAAARAIELDSTDALGYALRGWCVLAGAQLDRYSEALEDARRAHEMNPNDVFVLGCLAYLEAAAGEHERAIEHGHQILRLNPRDSRSYETYHMLGFASFGAKQYAKGIGWELRALNDKPEMIQTHVTLANCYVGANEIAKARAVFAEGQRRGPEFFKSRLEGNSFFARPEDRKRGTTFLRIAAGLEDPSAADALR